MGAVGSRHLVRRVIWIRPGSLFNKLLAGRAKGSGRYPVVMEQMGYGWWLPGPL